MTDPMAGLRSREKAEPDVLVRMLTTPPAAPWDQARVAALEAERAAPARGLAVAVRRIERWRPGKGGSFAAFYVRSSEVAGELTIRKQVEGKALTVRFGAEGRKGVDLGGFGATGLVALGIVLTGFAAADALGVRAEREAALASAEQAASRALARARGEDRTAEAARRLLGRDDAGASVTRAMADLTAMLEARDGAIPIEAVHWRPEGVAVEVRGEEAPFVDGVAERSRRPLRMGIWLWTRPNGPVTLAEGLGE